MTFERKKLFKRVLVIFLTMTALFILGFGIFVIKTLSSIPIEKLEPYQNMGKETGENILLEKGSLVSRSELKTFYLFSAEKLSFDHWIEKKIEEESLRIVDSKLFSITKEISLKSLQENHCKRVYCYQRRMPFNKIPSVFWRGLIGIEDFRFLEHQGIDLRSILRAIVVDIRKMKIEQGASTLTQQLAKNLFFERDKSFFEKVSRKIQEIIIAVYIESRFSKEAILEAYFNEFVWGSLQGIRIKGLHSASLFYFAKRPSEITPYEASILIAILNGPYYFHPIRRLDRLKKKTSTLYQKLVELNYFPKEKGNIWTDKNWAGWRKSLIKRDEARLYRSLYLSQREDSGSIDQYGKFIFVSKAEDILKQAKKRAKGKDIAVKAMIGEISNNNKMPFLYYSKYERSLEDSIQKEFHQVGSTLKPIVYSILFDHNYGPESEVLTTPLTLELKSGEWTPKEAHKGLPELVTIEEALLKSYNRPVIRLARDMGFEQLEKDLLSFIPKLNRPLGEYPAQLLGAVELSLSELFNIYQKFIHKECLTRTKENNILYLLSDPNKTTVRRSVGKHLKNMKFFGKTGTSNLGRDNWYVFFDGKNIGAIWVGLEGPRVGGDLRLYGGSTAFKIFNGFSRDRGKRFPEFGCALVTN